MLKNIISLLSNSITIGIMYYLGMIGILFSSLYHFFIDNIPSVYTASTISAIVSLILVAISVLIGIFSDINEKDKYFETETVTRVTGAFTLFVIVVIFLLIIIPK